MCVRVPAVGEQGRECVKCWVRGWIFLGRLGEIDIPFYESVEVNWGPKGEGIFLNGKGISF